MSVFTVAMDRNFTHASMAVPALWISTSTSEDRPIRIIARPGDLDVIGSESHVIQSEPLPDRKKLIWTLDLKPA